MCFWGGGEGGGGPEGWGRFFAVPFQAMEMKLKIVEGSPETIFAKVHRNARSDWYMKKHLLRRPPPFPGPNARPGLTPQEPLALTDREATSSYSTKFFKVRLFSRA